jgi:hypothetical protein
MKCLVAEHADDIANGETFVDSCAGGVVLACVFCSLLTKLLAGGFAEGRMYERGLVLWIREQSGYYQDLNYNNGGGGATPKDVATCGGSAWFTGGPTEVV